MYQSYKTELNPNNKQRTALERHAGAARHVFNWGLATWQKLYAERKALCEISGEKIGFVTSFFDLQNRLVVLKKTPEDQGGKPWLYKVSKWAPQEALKNLEKAYKNTFSRLAEGKKGGFPKFKSKHKCRKSFTLGDPIKVKSDRIYLPKIGWVRLFERNYIPTTEGVVKINSVTISEKAGRWYVSALVQCEQKPESTNTSTLTIGIDIGINALATCSDGTVYANPKALNKHQSLIKRLSQRLNRQQKGSNRINKTKLRLAKVHAKIANIRNDSIHKMTTEVVKTKQPKRIVIEDLNVAGMVKNHKLAMSILDAAFGEIKRQIEYKAKSSVGCGVEVVVVDRFFPSTKRCSSCGTCKESMDLSERIYNCTKCGLSLNRDLNAAYNLQDYPELGFKRKDTAGLAEALSSHARPLGQGKAGTKGARGVDIRPDRIRSKRQFSVKREVGSDMVLVGVSL